MPARVGPGLREGVEFAFFTICSITWSMLRPVFAEMRGASSAGMPMTSSISLQTRSGSALGKSTLLITGLKALSSPVAKSNTQRTKDRN